MTEYNLSHKKNYLTSAVNGINKQKQYEAIVKVWYQHLYRHAYWLCKDQHVAEDLTQETFLKAWCFFDSLKNEKAAKSWLVTILRRENARRFERKQLKLVDISEYTVTDKSCKGSEQPLEHRWLKKQIMTLAPKYREPLILQVLAGFNNNEIAAILGLKNNTVTTRLFRSRAQLRDRVGCKKVVPLPIHLNRLINLPR
jgi:RNA polymerase sigma-70 factor, ECF subfamily